MFHPELHFKSLAARFCVSLSNPFNLLPMKLFASKYYMNMFDTYLLQALDFVQLSNNLYSHILQERGLESSGLLCNYCGCCSDTLTLEHS